MLGRSERLGYAERHSLLSVVEGLIAVSTVLPDGRRQILCLNAPGETICPICSADCWIEALTPSRLRVIQLDHDGGSNEAMFHLTHDRLIAANAHLLTLGRLDGAERIAAFIVDMCRRLGQPFGQGGSVLHLPMARDDVADYLGLNAETVSRLFSKLKKRKIVLFPTPTELIVPDLSVLEARVPSTLANGARGHLNGRNGGGS